MSTSTTPKRPKQRHFTITFTIDGTPYTVAPLPIEPDIGHRAWRFHKQTAEDSVYDVHADAYGLQCQCQGFLRRGHCKHVETIQAAAKLFNLLSAAPPLYRSTGDMARNAPEVYAEAAGAARNPVDAWLDAPASEPWTDADVDGLAAANGQAVDSPL